jgi:beta-galactosidase/beta-glucuronidase
MKNVFSLLFVVGFASLQAQTLVPLTDFRLQASMLVNEAGARLSDPTYQPPVYWFPVKVPSTVLTGLVRNGVYPDPYQGMNNMFIPDASDEFNQQYQLEKYSHLPGIGNPWKKPYWYRTIFDWKTQPGRQQFLVLKGINYRAEVWLNGTRLADSTQLVGMFAEHELPIGQVIRSGANALAIKIYPLDFPGRPAKEQLKIFDDFYENGGPKGDIGKNVTMLCSVGWDWMPPVRDRNMGIWQPVFIRTTGPLQLEYPRVTTLSVSSDTLRAELGFQCRVVNTTNQPIQANLRVSLQPRQGTGKTISFSFPVTVGARSSLRLNLNSSQVPELSVQQPALWWPLGYGAPNLYTTAASLEINGQPSDERIFFTGIRTTTSTATMLKNSVRRDFFVNGKRIHLVGGAWVPDMMLQNDSLRIARELQLVKNANQNLVRIWGGGVTPSDLFFDLCDQLGLLVWNDFWVTGDTQGEFKGSPDWPLEGHVFVKNVTSSIYRIRHHASLLLWTGGNEGHARKPLYDAMRDSVIALDGSRPFIPSSSGFAKLPTGWKGSWPDDKPSGVYSGGPYTWQDPARYYELVEKSPDWVFKDETGIPSQPPYTTLPKIIPNLVWDKKAPFPFNDTWGYHDAATGNGRYDLYYHEMVKRFGEPTTMEGFSDQMQLMNAMGYQGIFEAPQSKLNDTGGVMLWKLNPAFPSVIWQLYDWYLLPNAGYYFSKNSCAPVHLQWNRGTRQIDAVNRQHKAAADLGAEAVLYDLSGKQVVSFSDRLTLKPSSVLPWKLLPANTNAVHFLVLRLTQNGQLINQNTYWLEPNGQFTSLKSMASATVAINSASEKVNGSKSEFQIEVQNTSPQVAFFTRLQLMNQTGEEVLPAYWADNYITLKPGERQTIRVWLDEKITTPKSVRVTGWNVAAHGRLLVP